MVYSVLAIDCVLGKFGRDSSSSGPDLTSHFSVSLDYGSDSPLSIEQISFNSLKERALSGEEVVVEVKGTGMAGSGTNGSLSFQEAVGKSCNTVRLIYYNVSALSKCNNGRIKCVQASI